MLGSVESLCRPMGTHCAVTCSACWWLSNPAVVRTVTKLSQNLNPTVNMGGYGALNFLPATATHNGLGACESPTGKDSFT